MNELLSIVQNYLATKDTDYAIMINGGGDAERRIFIKRKYHKWLKAWVCGKKEWFSLFPMETKKENKNV